MLTIRPETPNDHSLIDELLITAFAFDALSEQNEHLVVHQLRQDGDLRVALVADSSVEGLVGFIGFSPITISDGTSGWVSLGPVAVEPRFQRRGIGRQLMEAGLELIRNQGASGCVVHGDPEFHGQFGFNAVSSLTLPNSDPQSFLCQSFSDDTPTGTVTYAPAYPTR